MNRVAIIAAMAGELKPLVCGWQRERREGVDLWRWDSLDDEGEVGEWVAACAGAGVDAATRAFAEVERDGPISMAISTGWAGALSEEFAAGQAYRVSGVIDARTGERFAVGGAKDSGDRSPRSQNRDLGHPVLEEESAHSHPSDKDKDVARVGHLGPSQLLAGHPGIWLVTRSRVADVKEKQRLRAAYGTGLVDMEAAGVARLARMRGIPFYCVKGISDGYRDQLPDFNRFISPDGRFQLGRFVVFCSLRPWYWPRLMRMGENSRKAARNIAGSLLDVLNELGSTDKRNGHPNFKR